MCKPPFLAYPLFSHTRVCMWWRNMKSPVLCLRCQKVSHFLVLSSITGTFPQHVWVITVFFMVLIMIKWLCFCFQQLYQTLTDYDIRFYMYEILKVSPLWFGCLCVKNLWARNVQSTVKHLFHQHNFVSKNTLFWFCSFCSCVYYKVSV